MDPPPPCLPHSTSSSSSLFVHSSTCTHLQTSLFSFGIKAWPWPYCWGFLSNSPEGDPIMWHRSPSLTRYPLSWPCMFMRMKGGAVGVGGRTLATGLCVAVGAVIQLVITPRSNGVEVVPDASRLSKLHHGLTAILCPASAAVTNWAGLVILSVLNHLNQHMSGKGHFLCTMIHVQSELAAWIPVIAVAFPHFDTLQLPCCFNLTGSLSHFRAPCCLCPRVFLCYYVHISASWICLPYAWVYQDPS